MQLLVMLAQRVFACKFFFCFVMSDFSYFQIFFSLVINNIDAINILSMMIIKGIIIQKKIRNEFSLIIIIIILFINIILTCLNNLNAKNFVGQISLSSWWSNIIQLVNIITHTQTNIPLHRPVIFGWSKSNFDKVDSFVIMYYWTTKKHYVILYSDRIERKNS